MMTLRLPEQCDRVERTLKLQEETVKAGGVGEEMLGSEMARIIALAFSSCAISSKLFSTVKP